MKSRAFCCNAGLIRRDLGKPALLWVGYLLLWFVAMPGNLLSSAEWMKPLDMRVTVLELAADACHMVSFLYGLLVAWYLFSYLHKSRSANFFGALPLRRETQFLSHYVSGILCSVLPNLVLYGATVLTGAGVGVNLVMETAIWFAVHTLTYIFYYSLAVLCSMVVGNVIAMPVLYGVVNFVAVVVESLLRALLESLLYGFRFGHRLFLGVLSPLYYFFIEDNGPYAREIYENEKMVDCVFEGWEALLILAAVGVVFAVVAFFLHKSRRMEAAGDVIAVKRLRPVFLYVFTFGCTVVIGSFLASILVHEMYSCYFWQQAGCLFVGTFVGHFLGHMMLQRSLRVFERKNFRTCGICLVILLASLGAIRLDVAGVVKYVPNAEAVVGVRLDGGNHNVGDPQRIAEVIDLHTQIVDSQRETEALCRKSNYEPIVDVVYVLESGREVCREYRLPVTEENYKDPESLICQYDAINNTPEMILSRNMPKTPITMQTVENGNIYYNVGKDGFEHMERIEPKTAEVVDLWENAILLDLKAGNMGKNYYADNFQPTTDVPVAKAEYYSDVSVEIQLTTAQDKWDYCHFSIPAEAVHTKAALMEMGIPEEAFMREVR